MNGTWKMWAIGALGSVVLLFGAGTVGWLVSQAGTISSTIGQHGERFAALELKVEMLSKENTGRAERITRIETLLEQVLREQARMQSTLDQVLRGKGVK